MDTQKLKVLNHLRDRKNGLSSWEAIVNYRITRLAARIADLKEDGHTISAQMEEENGKRFARYYLIKEAS